MDDTAPELITAVVATFGNLAVDLAATDENAKAPIWLTKEEDSLTVDWHMYDGILWLNPDAGDQSAWSAKCAAEARKGAKILYLTEAALDTLEFWAHVWPHATVYMLHPRMSYDHRPVPLMLCAYNIRPPQVGGDETANLFLWFWQPGIVISGIVPVKPFPPHLTAGGPVIKEVGSDT